MTTDFYAWWVDNHDSHGDCYETARDAWNEQQKKLDTCREREGRLREALKGAFEHHWRVECIDGEEGRGCTCRVFEAARTALAEGKGEGR